MAITSLDQARLKKFEKLVKEVLAPLNFVNYEGNTVLWKKRDVSQTYVVTVLTSVQAFFCPFQVTDFGQEEITREIQLLLKLKGSPYIVDCLGWFFDENSRFNLVMEFVPFNLKGMKDHQKSVRRKVKTPEEKNR